MKKVIILFFLLFTIIGLNAGSLETIAEIPEVSFSIYNSNGEEEFKNGKLVVKSYGGGTDLIVLLCSESGDCQMSSNFIVSKTQRYNHPEIQKLENGIRSGYNYMMNEPEVNNNAIIFYQVDAMGNDSSPFEPSLIIMGFYNNDEERARAFILYSESAWNTLISKVYNF